MGGEDGGGGCYLIDVFVFEGPGAAERRGEVLVEDVCDPEEAAAALELDVVDRGGGATAPASVQPDGEGEVGKGSEEAPALVDAGLGEEVETLAEPGLHACQTHGTTLFGQLVLRGEVVSSTGNELAGKGGWPEQTSRSPALVRILLPGHVRLRLRHDNQQQRRLPRRLLPVPHVALRLVELLQ